MILQTRRPPRTHWVVLSALLAALLIGLFLAGLIDGQVGEGAQTPDSRVSAGSAPKTILDGGPVVDSTRPDLPGLRVPDRRIALTFDDGPTPWTADILDVLREHGVPATFFVVGARAADRPDLIQRMYREGHEVGVHTFSHVNLANVSSERERLELDQTQLAIAAATGHTTNLLRAPYSSQVANLTSSEWQAVQRAGNYRVVYTDLDTRDWERPGIEAIVRGGTPQGGSGAVVMMHDGGGDRSQTVAALGALIVELQQRGYEFTTVSSAVGLNPGWQEATPGQQLQGKLMSGVVRASTLTVTVIKVAFILLAVLAVLRTVLLLALARRHARRPAASVLADADLPAVSVVVPAYNEELGIEASVRSLAASDYPAELEIIVVDDGSTDDTSAIVRSLGLPNVRLVRQVNAGKPAALQTGVRLARHDVLVLVDGDTVFERDALRALVAPLAAPEVGAVSGNTKVGNRRGLLGRWQHIEYVIGFNLDRRMFDVLQCMPTVPGAIGAFRRQTLIDAGGIASETLAEDTDLTMAICRAGWRVVYAPEARAWTEAPASLGQLSRQRYRWCYGTMQAMWKHRHAVREHGLAGKLGRRGLPYLLAFQVALPLLAPAVDIATLYSVVFAWSWEIFAVWSGFLAMQLLAGAYAFRLDHESLRPLWTLPLQQFVYRQVMYLVVFQSVSSALYGLRLRWQVMRRTGELDAVPELDALRS
jgi:cellulose synthase/poly-beta-1,6-N-acetylglucosamine synthase-like glycosyltransferase/peptidoglycan/xylan/chitin deacetylase (PgdA/CDA1 family)